jgi:hypothetical protein
MSRKSLAYIGLTLALSLPRLAGAQEGPAAAPPAAPDPTDPVQVPPASAPDPAVPAPAPPPASAPAPAASPPAAVSAAPASGRPSPTLAPGEAVVHVAVNYRDAWLETRSYVDSGPFVRTCLTPCDRKLNVQGLEARVVAPGMTTSNSFRFDAGSGSAGVRVEGGSASARSIGIILLAAGIPVALGGMALFAQGKLKDNAGLQIAGISGLAIGGASVGISLPLLLKGTTHVKDAKGALIAISTPLSSL